ncbi:hypothetical protein PFISCL1PPCAC_13597 [Pristionchus fissidentatus]|uniref:B box-type domain-containing protein n=1 Tax=Pristionchus fissidentatus TaxID=1538716 RepID=A0AAV5VUT4_9BILA|nr:hypothetical protein PFISCL1PPCAC_13597 [Pristionchus fissidentatus]
MAEAEITIKEDDDLLNEITREAKRVAKVSGKPSKLRPRGSNDSRAVRGCYPVENNVFDNCQHCRIPLAGCISEGNEGVELFTNILTCGHVLCELCKEMCQRTRQEIADDRPLLQCPICHDYGAANMLPSPDNVNLSSCQAPYCSGEHFSSPQYRCVPCQRHICEGCKEEHAERFPEHELVPRPSNTININRMFTGCSAHQHPVTSRCNCGEMLCDRCPYNYTSHIPKTNVTVTHRKTRMEEVDLEVEDAIENSLGTVSRIRAMRSIAVQKKAELEETMDNMANEVALHFNQIIIQTIQRCFDVLKNLKGRGAKQHSAIVEHIKRLEKTERQIMMGVEIDERGRDTSLVTAENVSQYVRNVAYGLCKPAIEQFDDCTEYSTLLEKATFELTILRPETRQIMESIGRWGEAVTTNLGDVMLPAHEIRLGRTPTREAASLSGEGMRLRDILNEQPIVASALPVRLHSALDHFTDLHERRFLTVAQMEKSDGCTAMREFPFQLGPRVPPEAIMTPKEIEERHLYELYMHTRPGMIMMQPKIFGGFRRLFNLHDSKDSMTLKEVQGVYARTPVVAPIWMATGADASEITPTRSSRGGEERGEKRRVVDQGGEVEIMEDGGETSDVIIDNHHHSSTSPAARSVDDSSSRAATPAAGDVEEIVQHSDGCTSPPPQMELMQQLQPKIPAVLRKKNLVFVKRPDAATASSPSAPSPQQPTTSTGRTIDTTAQRRVTAFSFPPSAPKPTFFRPATTAERAAAAAAASPAAAARSPVVRPSLYGGAARLGQQQQQHRLAGGAGVSPHMQRVVRLVPPSKLLTTQGTERITRVIKDANGRMRVVRGTGMNTARVIARPPAGHPLPGGGVRVTMMQSEGNSSMSGDKLVKTEEPDGSGETAQSSSRVNVVRMVLPPENRHSDPVDETEEEKKRRAQLRQQGFRETEIDRIIVNHRKKLEEEEREAARKLAKHQERVLQLQHERHEQQQLQQQPYKGRPVDPPRTRNPSLQYIVNPRRNLAPGSGYAALAGNVPVPRFGSARGSMAEAQAMISKKRMLPIERAFTSMFGADGSIIPEWNNRRRGRPAKDDPTAPSNILEQFRKHTTQWPPKFDEMTEEEIVELQELIDQLDEASREDEGREEGMLPLFDNGLVKSEVEDPTSVPSPWHGMSQHEREKIKAAAVEKLQVAANPELKKTTGCFVCALFREHEGKSRTWQCNECISVGRELTPPRDGESFPPPPKKPRVMYNIRPPPQSEEEGMGDMRAEEEEEEERGMMEGMEGEEEEEAMEMEPAKVERRGRKKKERDPEEAVRTPREPKKRRETIEESPVQLPEEDVVVGTTRRGRQIKMPSKLKDYEAAPIAAPAAPHRRSPSTGSEAPSSSDLLLSLLPPVGAAARTTPRAAKKKEELREVKEEEPEPRSEMDGVRRGGRRGGRH